MIYIVIFIILNYLILIAGFSWGFDKVPLFKEGNSTNFKEFSIIIALRNEENNLPNLLYSLVQLNYNPANFEVILVDDQSTDNSKKVIEEFSKNHSNFNWRYFYNDLKSASPKKDALKKGIENARFNWILTTDADCTVSKNWLLSFNSFLQKNKSVMVAAPVLFTISNNFLERFQLLDFLSLIGATIGSFGLNNPIMANGANLCFNKQAYHKVNGYQGNENLASGDDIFLLEKMVATYKNQVHFLKSIEALVITQAQKTIKNLIQQRIRWASKATKYQNKFTKYVGLVVLLMNFIVCILLILALLKWVSFQFFSGVFLVKFIVDLVLISKTKKFFKTRLPFYTIFLSAFIYPFFTILIGLLSFRKKYEWKGRKFTNQG